MPINLLFLDPMEVLIGVYLCEILFCKGPSKKGHPRFLVENWPIAPYSIEVCWHDCSIYSVLPNKSTCTFINFCLKFQPLSPSYVLIRQTFFHVKFQPHIHSVHKILYSYEENIDKPSCFLIDIGKTYTVFLLSKKSTYTTFLWPCTRPAKSSLHVY